MTLRLGKGFLIASLAAALAAGCGGTEQDDAPAKEAAALTLSPKGTIKLDQPRYRARASTDPLREVIVITVADADLDASATAADTVSVTVGIQGSKVAAEKVRLTETDVSSAVFVGTIRVVQGNEVRNNGVLEAKDNDTIVATYKDANDGTGVAVTVTATAVVDNHSPDLTVTALGAPANAAGGATVPVTFTVANDSFGAAGPFQVAAQLFGSNGAVAAQTLVSVGGLALGASYSGQANVTVPAGLGAYTWKVVADPAPGAVAEFDETNNERLGPDLLVGPDLTVGAVSGPAAALAGAAVPVSYTIANATGGAPAGISYAAIQLVDRSGNRIAEQIVQVPALAGGQSTTGTATLTVPPSIKDVYTWRAIADVYGHVAEANEANNVTAGNDVLVTGADLTAPSVSGPATALAGETVTVSYTVANAQGAGAAGISYAAIQLVDGSGNRVAEQIVQVPALGGGQGTSGTATVTVPPSIKGGYAWRALVDVYGHVAEANEANNVTAGNPIVVTGADLTAPSVSGPATALAGETVTVSYTVANAQGAGAAGISYAAIQLVDTSGNRVAEQIVQVPALAGGQSTSGTATVTVPPSIKNGYAWRALVDVYGHVAESNEQNNATSGNAIAVTGADLTATGVSGPASALAGETVSVSYAIANAQGAGAAGISYAAIQLVDAAGNRAAEQIVQVPALAGGQSTSGTATVTVPTSAKGTYAWRALVDVYGHVTEANEQNNVTSGNAIVVGGADLTAPAVSGPAAALAGETVAVSYTIANAQGAGAAGISYAAIQLVDASGNRVAEQIVQVPALAAGQSTSGTATVTVPPSIKDGYRWRALVDVYGHVAESNEQNNVTTGNAIVVTGADLTAPAVSGPASALAGETVSVSYAIANAQGAGAAGISYAAIQLVDAGGNRVAEQIVQVPALAGGQSTSGTATVTVPTSAKGTYAWRALVDVYGHVAESNEQNNATSGNAIVVAGADLTASAVSGPAAAVAGETVPVSYTIANAPGGGAAGISYAAIQLVDAGGNRVAEQIVQVPALAAGQSTSGTATVTVPPSINGTYAWRALVDVYGHVAESNEQNNVTAGSAVAVTGADLSGAVTGPSAAAAGETVPVSFTITNAAGGGAAGISYAAIQLVDASGNRVAELIVQVPALAPGQSTSGTASVPVPASINGTYAWRALVDVYGHVAETNEQNNVAAGNAVAVTGADLIVVGVSCPPTAAPGSSVALSFTIANRGPGAAGTSYAAAQLVDPSGGRLAEQIVQVPPLAPGQSYAGSATLPVPASAGAYACRVIADVYGHVAETSEQNNVLTGNVVQVGP